MKFTLEDAYKELVGKMTSNGEKLNVTERTLKKHVETLMKYASKSNDEIELSDFITDIMPDCKELDGQYRKDNSDFINRWKEEHKTPETKPTETPKSEDDYAKKLEERIAALETKEREIQRQSAIASKRSDIIAAMKKKGVKDNDWCNSFVSEIEIGEDTDVDAKADAYVKIYNKILASQTGDGVTPKSSSSKPTTDKSEFADIIKLREKELKN